MKFGIDRVKVLNVIEQIKSEIEVGNLTSGEKMMSAEQLSKAFHISRMEANAVLRGLRKDGTLVNLGLHGMFIKSADKEEIIKNTIAVITADSVSSAAQRMLRGIERVANANGMNVICKKTGNSQKKEERIIKNFEAAEAAGYIIEPSRSQLLCKHIDLYRKLDEKNKPYVFVRSIYPQLRDKPRVFVDDVQGGYLITRHMIATIGENIVGIFRADDSRGSERHRGYVMALQEAGLPYRPELVIWYHIEEGSKKPIFELEQILKNYSCDGIICYNDAVATNIMYYLFDNGYNVPEDIAVSGYGNTAVATSGELGLTTVAQPDELMGGIAAEYIIDMIRGGSSDTDKNVQKVLTPELVIRGSTVGNGI